MLRQLKYNIIERASLTKDVDRLNKITTKKGTKYGINLEKLPLLYQNLLKNRLYVSRFSDDDRLLKMIFLLTDIENDHKSLKKYYYLPHIDKVVNFIDLKRGINFIKWHCAFCEDPIEINILNKNKSVDFLCDDCKSQDSKSVDERIVNNFFEFNNFITNKLEKDYKTLNKKILKNKKK